MSKVPMYSLLEEYPSSGEVVEIEPNQVLCSYVGPTVGRLRLFAT